MHLFLEKGMRGDISYIGKRHKLTPEQREISQSMLSKYCSDIADKYEIKIGGTNKLVPNLSNKRNMPFITEIFSCIYH